MSLRVLGVHGVSNYLGTNVTESMSKLAERWYSALLTSPSWHSEDIELRAAYYADLLRTVTPTAQSTDSIDTLEPQVEDLVLSWARDALGMPPVTAQGPFTRPLRVVVAWIANRYGLDFDLVDRFVSTFFSEVNAYFNSGSESRAAVRTRVAEAIVKYRPDVVVAHSLGSVVTYEALWATGLTVDRLVTIGSPLGMPTVVFPNLTPAPFEGVGAKPPGVGAWSNVADVGDLIAIPLNMGCCFRGLDRDIETTIHAVDFHMARHYLGSAEVRSAIADTAQDAGNVV